MSLTEAEQEPLPPPDPPALAVAHRVYRSQHRVVAGVAGGLSNAVGVAPMWGRLAFVVLTLFGGLGIAVRRSLAAAAGWAERGDTQGCCGGWSVWPSCRSGCSRSAAAAGCSSFRDRPVWCSH